MLKQTRFSVKNLQIKTEMFIFAVHKGFLVKHSLIANVCEDIGDFFRKFGINNIKGETHHKNCIKVMKISDFTEEMYNEIIKAAKRSLIMVGVTVDVHLDCKNTRGTEYLKLDTDKFNTTPVIYESVCIGGSAELEKVEGREGIYDLDIRLDYFFKTFGGGCNGTGLGILHFRVFEERKEVRFVGFMIR